MSAGTPEPLLASASRATLRIGAALQIAVVPAEIEAPLAPLSSSRASSLTFGSSAENLQLGKDKLPVAVHQHNLPAGYRKNILTGPGTDQDLLVPPEG